MRKQRDAKVTWLGDVLGAAAGILLLLGLLWLLSHGGNDEDEPPDPDDPDTPDKDGFIAADKYGYGYGYSWGDPYGDPDL